MHPLSHDNSSYFAAGGILDPSGLYTLIAGSWIKVALIVITLMVFGKAVKADTSKVATIIGLAIVGLAWLSVSATPSVYQNLGKSFAGLIGLGGG